MNDADFPSKIAASCPSGHPVRGDNRHLGRSVKCPECGAPFIFVPTLPTSPTDASNQPDCGQSSKSPTDSARSTGLCDRRLTDTGVMRILAELTEAADSHSRPTKDGHPCDHCGEIVGETQVVCPQCNRYLARLPHYLQRLVSRAVTSRN